MIMNLWDNKRYRYGILGGLVFILTILAFWIRILPFPDLAGTGNMIAGPDAWHNLRLIEVALENNLGYIFFEPMTLYPEAMNNTWGSVFTGTGTADDAGTGAGK